MSSEQADNVALTIEQQQYLAGFAVGSGIGGSRAADGGGGGDSPGSTEAYAGPDAIHRAAQDRTVAAGGKLCKEEKAKRKQHALDMWDDLVARAKRGEFPKGTDVLLTKFHGMFYVAPAQDSYMCRMRLPGGIIRSAAFRGVADIADAHAGGYAHVTTRANLQIREIPASDPAHVITKLLDLGIVTRGSGADNIRNITASPTAGIDPHELYDTRELAREMHHHILNHRELYGLPRKFNIAFDGGGCISSLAETNDVGYAAVRVADEQASDDFPSGVYFRLQLGGITGHGDFARDTGIMLRPEQCVPVASAIVRVFIQHGDRTDRNKARLKYLLDDWGFDKFIEHVETEYGEALPRFAVEACEPRMQARADAHVGVHEQKQAGLRYVGVVLPVGRIETDQMRAVADIAERYGSGTIRLTVWQNLLISDVKETDMPAVQEALLAANLTWQANSIRAGLVACTGSRGCKFAAGDTKGHALAIAEALEDKLELDQPINIHLTGCHHSCAQHYIGDIGLLATKVESRPGSDEMVEGYHVYVGGGHGEQANIGRALAADIPHDELPALLERLLQGYMREREGDESFYAFARRHEVEQLKAMVEGQVVG
ncbi:NirA family protein [Phycisphaerales bacterium AB-hyl4]|uniref:NirA family protein n=1 Tax=Natronomicrosphaera hydrolytica TaxID=3242702 RepID=A0ABV4U7J4_9BACT